MMKRFIAVAGMLAVMVSSSHAYWDYFSVIEEGSAEANYSTDGGLKIRFGIIDNLEVMATMGAPLGMKSDYSLGARYQVLPEMLALGLDFGIPTSATQNIGLAPSVQFHMGINDMISFGIGAGIGIDINELTGYDASGDPETGAMMNLMFGLELDFQLTEKFGLWVGCDFEIIDMTDTHDTGKDTEVDVYPGLGLFYSVDNLTVGTSIGIATDRTNRKGEADKIGLTAGVDFSIKF